MNCKSIAIADFYEITSTGEVYSTYTGKKKLRKAHITHKGYLVVRLKTLEGLTKSFSVHRLVAFKYLSTFTNSLQVDHIDGNKLNNNVTNLRMATNSENQLNAVRLGKVPSNQKPIGQYTLQDVLVATFDNGTEARKAMNRKDSSPILRCCRGIKPTMYGFKWRFL